MNLGAGSRPQAGLPEAKHSPIALSTYGRGGLRPLGTRLSGLFAAVLLPWSGECPGGAVCHVLAAA